MNALLARALDIQPDLVAVRRDLHRHPELSFREHRTAGIASAAVEALGYRVRRGVGRTGVVADLGDAGPLVALRADMDALPIQEENEVDYRSAVPGVMHACGHDAHVSMLLGAARLLADAHARGDLRGRIRLLFQPSEEASDDENLSGAARMVQDGAMQDVDAVFGAHIGGHLPAGKAYLRAGPIMAGSDLIAAEVLGRSAHAARPHEGIDAIVLAAHCVLACQNAVARRLAPVEQGVLTIGTIAGGVAENVIADRVRLGGTMRYFEPRVRETLHDALRAGLAVAETLGGETRLDIRPGYPPVVNDDALTELAANAIAATLGADAVADFEPMMGAEDFAILQAEAPGTFLWIGAGLDPAREHHHPRFDIDESALPRGAAALAACAMAALEEIAVR